ncbi:peptidoglycan-binding domain-containing protein [Haloglycomyces albus]|uniref:peptidoglycan-binding domain-containing protein n=1 Tax=Haloglycomyces albus TaxID=526067 RepID=UPI00146FAE2D|nr:peptidoglycan-binding domain-containing protein [Haloglycomyces albus]
MERTEGRDVLGPESVAGTSKAIVTDIPVESGDQVDNGALLLEVSGRPVFALAGEVDVYRDFVEGETSGDDVRQLQTALSWIYGTPVTGNFDARTAADVRKFYQSSGYSVMEESQGDSGSPEDDPGEVDGDSDAHSTRVTIPASEIVFLSSMPMSVSEVHAEVNDPSGQNPALSLASGEWQAAFELTPEVANEIRGQGSDWTYELSGGAIKGQEIEDYTLEERTVQGDNDMGEPREQTKEFLIAPIDSDDLAEGAAPGSPQTLEIVKARSDENALIVPVSALWTTGDKSMVTVLDENNEEIRQVQVETSLRSGGRTVIVVVDGTLEAGERVAVARRDGSHA